MRDAEVGGGGRRGEGVCGCRVEKANVSETNKRERSFGKEATYV